MVSSLEVCR